MIETLRSVLDRAEIKGGDVLHRRDVRSWPTGTLDRLVTTGVLRPIAHAADLEYKGCDHDCLIARDFQPHPYEEGRIVCIHRCGLGCGLVVLDPPEFDRWQFSLIGLAGVVRQAIGSKGEVVEDVRERLVSVGYLGDAARTVEAFVARGLQWPDAAKSLADAKRLKAADNPLVLTLRGSPDPAIWPTMKPAHAVLTEHWKAASISALFSLDLSPLLALESIPHPGVDRPAWIRHKEAAIKLRGVSDNMTVGNSERLVTEAVQCGAFTTNRQTGHRLRINLDSFNTWLWEQQKKNLDEDRDDSGNIVKCRRSRRPTSKAKR